VNSFEKESVASSRLTGLRNVSKNWRYLTGFVGALIRDVVVVVFVAG